MAKRVDVPKRQRPPLYYPTEVVPTPAGKGVADVRVTINAVPVNDVDVALGWGVTRTPMSSEETVKNAEAGGHTGRVVVPCGQRTAHTRVTYEPMPGTHTLVVCANAGSHTVCGRMDAN